MNTSKVTFATVAFFLGFATHLSAPSSLVCPASETTPSSDRHDDATTAPLLPDAPVEDMQAAKIKDNSKNLQPTDVETISPSITTYGNNELQLRWKHSVVRGAIEFQSISLNGMCSDKFTAHRYQEIYARTLIKFRES
ncbi:Hypothetical protein, putative [Bodo saltans]|uniref:Membrane-associated protein n=1 Tax=Bodo saltans TaxID=75058 RepID=A0A0S4JTL0_BODSA|nr:Hypothetical protein, putative [Bodo saltans]|eukprot:CUG93720.1 Hypothetical protein, putative [Bodo saltans]